MGVPRKSVLATTMIGAGIASTSGAAFADTDGGLVDVSHVQTIIPLNLCNNDLNVDVADLGGLLGGDDAGHGDHHGDHHGDRGSCRNEVQAWN